MNCDPGNNIQNNSNFPDHSLDIIKDLSSSNLSTNQNYTTNIDKIREYDHFKTIPNDDFFDSVIDIETHYINKGKLEGAIHGLEKGRVDGETLGYRYGLAFGEEFGFYTGFVSSWLTLTLLTEYNDVFSSFNHGEINNTLNLPQYIGEYIKLVIKEHSSNNNIDDHLLLLDCPLKYREFNIHISKNNLKQRKLYDIMFWLLVKIGKMSIDSSLESEMEIIDLIKAKFKTLLSRLGLINQFSLSQENNITF